MPDAVFEHLVAAVEGMLGGLTHLQQTVPQAFGLGPVLTAARSRMQEVRNLMAPPEPPVAQAEDPPKIEDIHGELPPPPVPDEPPVVPDAPDVPVPVEPAPPVPDAPPEVAPPEEPPIGEDAAAPAPDHS